MDRVMAEPDARSYTDEALRVDAQGEPNSDFVRVFADKIPKTYGAPILPATTRATLPTEAERV